MQTAVYTALVLKITKQRFKTIIYRELLETVGEQDFTGLINSMYKAMKIKTSSSLLKYWCTTCIQTYTITRRSLAAAGRKPIRQRQFTPALQTPFQFLGIRSRRSLQVPLKQQKKHKLIHQQQQLRQHELPPISLFNILKCCCHSVKYCCPTKITLWEGSKNNRYKGSIVRFLYLMNMFSLSWIKMTTPNSITNLLLTFWVIWQGDRKTNRWLQ